ncbi:hypothetical protein [Methanogenium organophilum]|uniref:Uncharacterized protein n=1 Tax=Methanogenium organophilum TaxID=2199 RepID=A0A9X9S6T6_METOG|nr:hypothetical protein [Methanogenium organophilum]WAI01925.1 hypothetical protein OU421_03390 [Methanogenium organophilum]
MTGIAPVRYAIRQSIRNYQGEIPRPAIHPDWYVQILIGICPGSFPDSLQ